MRVNAIQGKLDVEAERLRYAVEHMNENLAYLAAKETVGGDADGSLLRQFQEKYRWYRESWHGQAARAIENKAWGEAFDGPPLCVDIELAAVCDLGCPFCYRQFIATPDKIMDEALAFRLVDQCAEIGVPSLKLNWRGEPLLNPSLPKVVAYAKQRGILEVIINTNATKLDRKMSEALVDAGLDLMIYSFDGADAESYEKMRPGRFKPNSFDDVLGNIRTFHEVRSSKGARFPRTKIQMILTEDTFPLQEKFFSLFEPIVDDVSVKAYTERGGKISDLASDIREQLKSFIEKHNLSEDVAYWRDPKGRLLLGASRLPCEQPFQRLLVTYDGSVSMCCYDWENGYPVGYVDDAAINFGDSEYSKVMEKAERGAPGFELLSFIKMPKRYGEVPREISTLAEIWHGAAITEVRRKHIEGKGGDVSICKNCPFKETYNWIEAE